MSKKSFKEFLEAYDPGFEKMMSKVQQGRKKSNTDLMSHFGSDEYNMLRDMGIYFYEKPTYWEEIKGKYETTHAAIEKAEKEIGVPFKIYTQDKIFTGKKSNSEDSIDGAFPLSDADLPKEPVFIVHMKDGSMWLADGTQANSYIRMWARIKD